MKSHLNELDPSSVVALDRPDVLLMTDFLCGYLAPCGGYIR